MKEAKEKGIITNSNIINSSKDYVDPEIIRYKIDIPNYGKLDIFQHDKGEVEISKDNIRWGNPIYAMERKFEYFREKDNTDFWNIKKKVDADLI